MAGMQLIIAVRIEASRVKPRAKLQYTMPLGMPLSGCTLGREPPQSDTR